MLPFKPGFRLFINNEEYLFEDQITFEFHPTNFSSITFNDVIKKSLINKIDEVFINREFTFVEIRDKDGVKVLWIGFVNDTGRLSLLPNSLKTFSIKVSDFRKWLSLTKPITKIYLNKSPREILSDLIQKLGEPRIQMGSLNFDQTNDFTIKAYSTENKTLYQIFKDVIERQTNSILYFTFKEGVLFINYKSKSDFENIHPIQLDLKDNQFLKDYQILDIEYENDTTDYYNYLTYSSDNVISKIFKTETNLSIKDKTISLWEIPIIIVNDIEYTFIQDGKTGLKKQPIILNKEDYIKGQYYDFLFSPKQNVLEVNNPNEADKLTISYYVKTPLSIEAKDNQEILNLSRISKTNGIVFKQEKFNDISNPDDLLTAVRNDLSKYAKPKKTLTVTCRKLIWNLLDSIKVINANQAIDGFYIIKSLSGSVESQGSELFYNLTYNLQESRNLNMLVNKYDNQSYRDNPVIKDKQIVTQVETLQLHLKILIKDVEQGEI